MSRDGPDDDDGTDPGSGDPGEVSADGSGPDRSDPATDGPGEEGDTAGSEPRWRRALRGIATASPTERLLISVAALVLAILVGGVLVLVSGWAATCRTPSLLLFGEQFCYDPVEVYLTMFYGAIGGNPLESGWTPTSFGVANTLKQTTLLVFTGLSVAVAFRAGMFNIGTQGQLVLGALGGTVAGLWVAPLVPAGLVGGILVVVVILAAGSVVGGLYGALPGAMKAYFDANEVITTIMLNFIAVNVAFVLTAEALKDPTSQSVQTRTLPAFARLQGVVFPERGGFSLVALLLAGVLAYACYYLLWNTSAGYDLRTGGLQPEAAEYGGVNADRTIVASMTLSGALGGFGGGIYVLMVHGRMINAQQIPALGFDGITVSILAGNHPLGVGLAALLFGVLKSGSLALQLSTEVPPQLVGVLRGLIILFVAMPEFFRLIGRRTVLRGRGEGEVAATDGGVPEGGADPPAGEPGDPSGGDRCGGT